MEHPKAIGETSQLAIMLGLDQAGYAFFVPFSENTRYDLVIDEGYRLARVQCKTGRLKTGAVRFRACSSYAHHPNPKILKRDYLGEIDYFGVYCPETKGVYLVPIDDVPVRREGALRVDPTRNGQAHGVRLAADYQIAQISIGKAPGRRRDRLAGRLSVPASSPAG
jgi:PD-(D/E)XK endonuclease